MSSLPTDLAVAPDFAVTDDVVGATLSRALRLLDAYLVDDRQVQAASLQALAHLAQHDQALRRQIIAVAGRMTSADSAAVRSRSRIVLDELTRSRKAA